MGLAHADTHRWTIDHYERLYAQGFLPRDAHVELIEGEIVHMPPMLPPHSNSVMQINSVMSALFGSTHWIRVQSPVNIPRFSQPEPDLALVAREGYDKSVHPTHADLVIEVAESSLAYDRGEKASLYARAGFPELWIVNLVDGVLEVYRDPQPPGSPFGYHYRTQIVLLPDASIAPLFLPTAEIAVSDLL